jgi:hypothetical protein
VGGEGELGDQNRTSEGCDSDTETDKESRSDEHSKVLGGGLDCDSNESD